MTVTLQCLKRIRPRQALGRLIPVQLICHLVLALGLRTFVGVTVLSLCWFGTLGITLLAATRRRRVCTDLLSGLTWLIAHTPVGTYRKQAFHDVLWNCSLVFSACILS